uniref:LITAF domain-containing protein n=1 Tax=Oryzias melastigma TaxID=30732 RepID=A0A3B3CGT5_ORYME
MNGNHGKNPGCVNVLSVSFLQLCFVSFNMSVAVRSLGDNPVQIACPQCHQTVLSKVDHSAGLLTYLLCGGLFFCGFVLGCCLIPFCVDRVKDAKHTCPSCKTVLGIYKRL